MSKLKAKGRAKPGGRSVSVRPKFSPSTALVRVATQLDRAVGRMKHPEVPAVFAAGGLTEEIAIGTLGKFEITFSAAEEMVLAEKVDVNLVQIKPSGQPYLSHPAYTTWFNRAFNRGGWSLVPIAKPAKTDSGVAVPYLLYVHGKPAAFAMGEGDYKENNREQTWGDALEATVASGLRRCAKRLGVGLELWDRRWLNRFITEHCVLVKVNGRHGLERQWRRVDDPELRGEIAAGKDDGGGDVREAQRAAPATSRFPPRSSTEHRGDRPITEKQVGRLWTIVQHAGRTHEEVNGWLKARYGWTSSKQITMDAYDRIVRAIEARGELPPAPDALAREAGSEG